MEQIGTSVSLDCLASSEGGNRTGEVMLPTRCERPLVLPVMFDPEIDIRLPRRVQRSWKETGKPRALYRELTPAERDAVLARRNALIDALVPFMPSERADVEGALAAMFASKPAMRDQGEDAVARIAVYCSALRQRPPWAIIRACDQAMREPSAWAPSAGQVDAAVGVIVEPYRRALEGAETLLTAPVEPVEDSAAPGLLAPPQPRPPSGLLAPIRSREEPWVGDGKHGSRVTAQLAARKAQREAAPDDWFDPVEPR